MNIETQLDVNVFQNFNYLLIVNFFNGSMLVSMFNLQTVSPKQVVFKWLDNSHFWKVTGSLDASINEQKEWAYIGAAPLSGKWDPAV